MDLKRLFIIVIISLIFITLFCDDIIEGNTDDEIEVERCEEENTQAFETLKDCLKLPDEEAIECGGEDRMTNSCIRGCIVPILNKHEDVTSELATDVEMFREARPIMDEIVSLCAPLDSNEDEDKDEDEDEDEDEEKIFGVNCVENCEEFAHECEIKIEEEYVDKGGKRVKEKVKTYDNVENCPHGELPEKTCSDDKWECKLCKPGFYLDSNDNLCKPNANFGPSLLSSCCSLLCCLPLFIYIFILIREWWERRSARNEALGTMSGIAYGRQKYNYNPNLAISP